MELVLDTADLAKIKELDSLLNVAGVTTNPTIITKSGKQPEEVIGELIDYLRPDQKLFVQVVATDYDGIMAEARKICGLRPENTYAKIPVSRTGLKACKDLSAEGLGVLATAIYSAELGFLAALNGAAYLAPYVNRMSNYGDGVRETCELHQMLVAQNLPTKIVAASFHSVNQVHELVRAGIDAVTLPPSVLDAMLDNPCTDVAVDEFTCAWKASYGRTTLFA